MRTLSAKEIGYGVNHFIESVTENWRYFQFSPIFIELIKYSNRLQKECLLNRAAVGWAVSCSAFGLFFFF